jgi:hypothetical protein
MKYLQKMMQPVYQTNIVDHLVNFSCTGREGAVMLENKESYLLVLRNLQLQNLCLYLYIHDEKNLRMLMKQCEQYQMLDVNISSMATMRSQPEYPFSPSHMKGTLFLTKNSQYIFDITNF